MPSLTRNMSQVGDPASRIRSVGIVSAALTLRIINSWELRHVGAHARDPLPVARRDCWIVLDEPTIPFVTAHAPVHRQVEAEERGRDRSNVRVHPSRLVQLTDARIDERVTGLTRAPRVERRMVLRQRKSPHLLLQWLLGRVRVKPRKLQEEIPARERAQKQPQRSSLLGERERIAKPFANSARDRSRRNRSER